MIVNTASSCRGASKKYSFLGELQKNYNPKGLEILAMPTNDFNGERNPNSKIFASIQNSLLKTKGAMFKILAKGEVNGPEATHLYKFIRQRAPESHIKNHDDGA